MKSGNLQAALCALALPAFACNTPASEYAVDGGTSSAADASTGADAKTFTGSDAGTSAGSDAGGSTRSDAGTSAGADAGGSTRSDAGTSAGSDAGTSTGADAGTSAGDGGLGHFSFFVTSLKSMLELSGNPEGFGGDLRYGETGPGAGLRGADKICATVAEKGMAGASAKPWRAFLSVTADENGKQVDAIDRIGNGPWYDRLGRLFANNKSELLNERPLNANSVIKNDFPNEFGVTNQNPDLTGNVDNHDILTGSNAQGRLYSSTATCKDWTTSDGSSANGHPRVGHSWPTAGTGGGFGGWGGAGGSMANWMSALDEAGCAADVYLIQDGAAKPGTNGVGSGGGYGGIYCFALEP